MPDLEICSQERGGSPKHVYLMDMNDLYLVAVKLDMACNWMACTEKINPGWRADPRLQRQAQDLLWNSFLIEDLIIKLV